LFAIYDTEGRHFRDIPENLHKVREAQASIGLQLHDNAKEVIF